MKHERSGVSRNINVTQNYKLCKSTIDIDLMRKSKYFQTVQDSFGIG